MGAPFQVVLGSLYVVVEHLYYAGNSHIHIFGNLGINHFLLAFTVVDGLLHHAGADGCHLGAMLGIHDRGHDVTTEGGTNLIEQVVKHLVVLLVLVGTDLQFGAVGCQSAGQRRTYAGTEVTANHRGTHQTDLRLLLLEEVYDNVGVGSRCVREQSFAVENKQLVNAVGQNLILHLIFNTRTDDHGMEFHIQLIGQLAALGQQFLGNLLNLCTFNLAIYKYVVHIFVY